MKTYLGCIPCLVRQAVEASRMATHDTEKQRKAIRKALVALSRASFDATPSENAHLVHEIVKRITKNNDPYRKVKERDNIKALKLYPILKRKVSRSRNKPLAAVKIAIIGNVIDYGPSSRFDVEEAIKISSKRLAIDDFSILRKKLDKAGTVAYLSDNAGEIVFDRLLLEELKKDITFFVKARPILNDATMKDAKAVGIDKLATIKAMNEPDQKVVRSLKESDVVISKGQGNYERLSDLNLPIFFLLKVKCPIIAEHIHANVGDMILKFVK